jgi:hypothetical protein
MSARLSLRHPACPLNIHSILYGLAHLLGCERIDRMSEFGLVCFPSNWWYIRSASMIRQYMRAHKTYHSLPMPTLLICVVRILAFALPADCLFIIVVETVDQVGLIHPHAFKTALIPASPGGRKEVQKREGKRALHGCSTAEQRSG